jgi:hypothetical protein
MPDRSSIDDRSLRVLHMQVIVDNYATHKQFNVKARRVSKVSLSWFCSKVRDFGGVAGPVLSRTRGRGGRRGVSVPSALACLDSRHVAFDRAAAPGYGQSVADCIVILGFSSVATIRRGRSLTYHVDRLG